MLNQKLLLTTWKTSWVITNCLQTKIQSHYMLCMSSCTPVRHGRWRSRQLNLKKTVKQRLSKTIDSGKFRFFGHIIRNAKLSQTSSLMSQTLKLVPRIVVQRIGKKVLLSNNKEQFVSMSDKNILNGISSLRFFWWQKIKSLDDTIHLLYRLQKGVLTKKNTPKKIDSIETLGVQDKDLCPLQTFYWQQKATVKIYDEENEAFNKKNGVKRGCEASPLLHNAFNAKIMWSIIESVSRRKLT